MEIYWLTKPKNSKIVKEFIRENLVNNKNIYQVIKMLNTKFPLTLLIIITLFGLILNPATAFYAQDMST